MPNAADLPDDIAVLKVMLVARDAALAQSQNTVAELTQALSSRELQIEALQLQIREARRADRAAGIEARRTANR